MKEELKRLRKMVEDAKVGCNCCRCVKDQRQHHNGPCASDRARVPVEGRMVLAKHRIWQLQEMMREDSE